MTPDTKKELHLATYFAMDCYTSHPDFHSGLTDADGFIDFEGDYQIVSFRGTNNAKEWLLNASAVPYRYRKAWVHFGFMAHFRSIWGEMKGRMRRDKKILLTGHSLGGANAELACLWLYHEGFPDVRMITFGKPNVFTRWGSPRIVYKRISVVHGSDIVARIPRVAYGPSKAQEMLYFGNNGLDVWNPSKEYRKEDWQSMGSVAEMAGDHFMSEYVARVNRFIERIGEEDA